MRIGVVGLLSVRWSAMVDYCFATARFRSFRAVTLAAVLNAGVLVPTIGELGWDRGRGAGLAAGVQQQRRSPGTTKAGKRGCQRSGQD